MSVYFNELTLDEVPQQNYQLLKAFQKVWSRFVKETDKKIKFMILPDEALARLWDALKSQRDPAMLEFMHYFNPKFMTAPEDDFSPFAFDRFMGAEYRIVLGDGTKVECQSLGWAALNRSVTLGLESSPFWGRLCYQIEEETLDDGASEVEALCITRSEHIDDAKVRTWIAVNRDFEDVPDPSPSSLSPDKKEQPSFNVPHHENEKLKVFCEKIVKHPYVEGVVGTLPFDSTTSRFILRCYEDGKIDVRLHWTETGCGLKVQTTGKGIRQTELIGEILKDKYDRHS